MCGGSAELKRRGFGTERMKITVRLGIYSVGD